jgi:hypothetical protein
MFNILIGLKTITRATNEKVKSTFYIISIALKEAWTVNSEQCLEFGLGKRGIEFRFPVEGRNFVCYTALRPVLESTETSFQWIRVILSLKVNQQGSEADHSPASRAQDKNACSYTMCSCRSA